ncbi:aromatic-ring-hydroxylating dioxygenase subunit beta [Novosphingobium sp. FKTRR1]|uniref:aromatic-ring-hydroxylating dioxygenase subunit beta n=1 Tax=Novosphingobium sp. FKTRR1 TaxID=2879118 RepID=UPI001CEFC077|nr:aromatic-ring-hydroxylating dioxygenase subunit beta [Novosphingobium sp. FKTRR1]
MSLSLTRAAAEDLLYREALYLDTRRWDEWLALYLPDATFHVPAWRDETSQTQDPETELSLVWYKGRANLEDRVWRARSGLSLASSPLPRVVHLIANVVVEDAQVEAGTGVVGSAFTVHLHDPRAERTHAFFGRYRHVLVEHDGAWRIAAKTVHLLNDVIPTVIDFHSL